MLCVKTLLFILRENSDPHDSNSVWYALISGYSCKSVCDYSSLTFPYPGTLIFIFYNAYLIISVSHLITE